MDRITLSLLGPAHLGFGTRVVQPPHRGKVTALLAYLAVESGRRHRRDELAALLWPHMASDAALGNLRQTLLLLKRLIGDHRRNPPLLTADRTTVALQADGEHHWVDVEAFIQPVFPAAEACAPKQDHCTLCLAAMHEALNLYRGELLEGFHLDPELDDFTHWLETQRRYFHRRVLKLIDHLRRCHEKIGNGSAALSLAQRYVRLEPLDEAGVRTLMRLETAAGHRAEAFSQFELLRKRLASEIEVAPALETTALYEALLAEADRLPAPASADGEWMERDSTVLFCRLPVSRDGPVHLRVDHLRTLRQWAAAVIEKAHGRLASTPGDSLLAYFGAPASRRGASLHAVEAAWAITRHAPTAGARFGIHTGPVLPAEDNTTFDLLGATTAIAQQICTHATPGEILVSAAAAMDAAFRFDCEGEREILSEGETLRYFRIAGRSTNDVVRAPFMGRDEEIAWLRERWSRAQRGAGEAILIVGEAGIGKTRLVHALLERLVPHDIAVRRMECRPETAQSSFHPLVELLRQLFGLDPKDTPEVQLACIEAHVDQYALARDEVVPLLARLLSLPLGHPYAAPPLPPPLEREMVEQLQLRLLHQLAARQPVLLWVEDLQWADASLLRLLERTLGKLAGHRVMLVITARPGTTADTFPIAPMNRLALGPLPAQDAEELAAQLVADEADAGRAKTIARRAAGVPLVIHELVRRMHALDGSDAAFSSDVHELLRARMEALAPEDRRVVQAAAVLGHHFNPDQLAAVVGLTRPAIHPALRRLADAGLVRHVREPDDHFEFDHSLTHEAAYGDCAMALRQKLHARAAAAIVESSALAEGQPELVAHHYEAAGEAIQAIEWGLRAGRRSASRGADVEATAQLRRGLALLGNVVDQYRREALELELLLALGTSQSMVEGFAAPATLATWQRARALADGHDSVSQQRLFHCLWGIYLATMHQERDYAGAERLCREMAAIAESTGERVLRAAALLGLGHTHYWQGRFAQAERELRDLEALSPESDWPAQRDLLLVFPVIGESYRALALWALGQHEQALTVMAHANAIAKRAGDARGLVGHLHLAARLHQRRREPDIARRYAEEALAISSKHGFTYWVMFEKTQIAWSKALGGDATAVDDLVASRRSMMAIVHSPLAYTLALQTEAALAMGRFELAIAGAREGIAITSNGDGLHRVEFLRLHGEALAASGRADEAVAPFEEALALASDTPSIALHVAIAFFRHAPASSRERARSHLARHYALVQAFPHLPDVEQARGLLASD